MVCFLLYVTSLILEFVFICRKKNTFLLRLFVYLSVAVTLYFSGYSSFILLHFLPGDRGLCRVMHTLLQYSSNVERSFVLSINIILLYKVCSSFRSNQQKNFLIDKLSDSNRKCLEALFVALNFSIPGLALATYLGVEQRTGVCFLVKHSLQCYLEKNYLLIDMITFEFVPNVLDSLLSLLCVCILLVWLCWLRSRLLLKARIVKEVGAWFAFLVVYCVVGILVAYANFTDTELVKKTAFVMYCLLHSCIPMIFIGYICVSLCPCSACKSSKMHRGAIGRNASIQTSGLRTTPPSTRVSLPSDTAEHAPDFLSPSWEHCSEKSALLSSDLVI